MLLLRYILTMALLFFIAYISVSAFKSGGLGSLVSVIVFGGALGGIAFSLEDKGSHKMRLPMAGKEIDTGVIGHIIVGISSSFLAVAACMVFLDLDVYSLVQYTTYIFGTINQRIMDHAVSGQSLSELTAELSRAAISSTIYILAVSIIGGYSGLRLISGFSSAMLKKVEQELDIQKNEVASLKRHVVLNTEKDIKTRRELKELKLVRASMLMDNHEYHKAVGFLTDLLEESPKNAKAWSWKGRALRKLGRNDEALIAARKAMEVDESDWLFPYNVACYLCSFTNLTDEPCELLKKAGELAQDDHYSLARFIEGLHEDPDLKRLRDENCISDILSAYPPIDYQGIISDTARDNES